jgi:DNA-binding NarL/FixJ family response regulator
LYAKDWELLERPMSLETLHILFLGEQGTWLKVAQAVVEAPGSSIQLHSATSLRDAMHCLASNKWEAVLLDLQHPPAKELLLALQLHSVFHAVPAIALVQSSDAGLEEYALRFGAAVCLALEGISTEAVYEAAIAARASKKSLAPSLKPPQALAANGTVKELIPESKMELVSHAVHNLLCVISANADILGDQVGGSQPAAKSVDQIKKAAKAAAELMRQLKTT